MSIYKMGQYRFEGKDSCLTSVDGLEPVNWTTSVYNTSFTDMAIGFKNDSTFKTNTDYFMKVQFPRNEYYAYKFNIKLVKKENDKDSSNPEVFQWITSESIEKLVDDEAGQDVGVVLFQNPFSEHTDIKAAIPQQGRPTVAEAYALYQNDGNYMYAAGDGSEPYKTVQASKLINATWGYGNVSATESNVYFEFAFRPIEPGFSHVLFELERDSNDFANNGARAIPADESVVFEVYEVNNFLGKRIDQTQLSHIGVWGKPGTLMCVNGEPIRIGPRGYYEQDSIPITSIGVVAENHSKMFSIDYKYPTN